MENDEDPELPPRKVEYLKFLYMKGGKVRTSEISREFSVDPSTITKTMQELSVAGLLIYKPYHGIRLTDRGRRYAAFLIKRHRILSLVLTHYGLTHDQACTEASRFESMVSRAAIDRICASMGHPGQGVCGEITHDEGCLDQEPV